MTQYNATTESMKQLSSDPDTPYMFKEDGQLLIQVL